MIKLINSPPTTLMESPRKRDMVVDVENICCGWFAKKNEKVTVVCAAQSQLNGMMWDKEQQVEQERLDATESDDSSLSSGLGSESVILKEMVNQLSDTEKETAARSSYAYYKMSETCAADGRSSKSLEESRDRAAMAMAARHLKADKGDVDAAMKHFKATIEWRREHRLDSLRTCFQESTTEALQSKQRVKNYVGKGKLVIAGFDRENRACWHTVGRLSPKGSQSDDVGCMQSHYYMLERSIACSEARSLHLGTDVQQKVVVSVDFGRYKAEHAPTFKTIQELLCTLRDHYPERLYRIYLVDAPFMARTLWAALKPFVDPDTKTKFQFVTGSKQRNAIFGHAFGSEQCMPYQHPEGTLQEMVDMDNFFMLPFHKC
ncbi:Phosphatidylinositol transfer protein [Seminavis robusta]|uniref:Phosphatidylinositol transfer protein n=1 Tax=Seminavis robusta TaxID=568900 RepID=A0A9N8DLB7_9STRA|nr:Phosphatidylinositol transfer protein [Seminavis robusta]|eukprot:Sro194_g082910.1 Phosphatidylinositol transfer protein (375) ;mRNA; f:61818-63034